MVSLPRRKVFFMTAGRVEDKEEVIGHGAGVSVLACLSGKERKESYFITPSVFLSIVSDGSTA